MRQARRKFRRAKNCRNLICVKLCAVCRASLETVPDQASPPAPLGLALLAPALSPGLFFTRSQRFVFALTCLNPPRVRRMKMNHSKEAAMKAQDVMTQHVISVGPNDSIARAVRA